MAPTFDYFTGWRLHALTLSICLSLFLASLEVSIVATSLVEISADLHNFSEISWVISAYLLTYAGFLVIWARWSDLVGRKGALTTAITIFTIFSGACGAAQSSRQLITFRALQGLGGSGMTSVTLAIITEMVPPAKYALYSSITAMSFAFSYLLGPIMGAAINEHTTWRWVFLIDVPAGVMNALMVQLSITTNFPHHLHPLHKPAWYSFKTMRRLDLLGCFLLFGASAMLVASLEEAGLKYQWKSSLIIVLLLLCGLFWIGFVVFEWFITKKQEDDLGPEPVFPWRFVRNRVFLSMLLCAFAAGVPFTVSFITIPQRLQTVNSYSAFDAGVRLMPFATTLPVGSILQSTAAKRGVPCIILLFIGSCLQVAGTAAQITLPTHVTARMYGEQVITGLGVGINLGILILWTPFQAKGADTSVGMSSVTQIRALGGVVGVAIVTNIFNAHVRNGLQDVNIPSSALNLLLQSPYAVSELPIEVQDSVKEVFAEGYRKGLRVLTAFSAVQVLSVVGMIEPRFRKVV
ncbi:MFS multidrug transporter-like protein [Lophiostoma macrostomum CBS 122681]|uniref:MFS multidrug transporter-like protein n=1 Tax=Lophiostoma macrostomum CBS 122681 TaxID=1314788 RepID=A0A6A6TBG6_9PLEO|nr:MFS multidrug transporter-like protein [Lophiostoma macrostomum CBS 122681]